MKSYKTLLCVLFTLQIVGCGGSSSSETAAAASTTSLRADAGADQAVNEAEAVMLSGQAQVAAGRAVRRVSWSQLDTDTIRAMLPSDVGQAVISFQAPQVEQDTALTFIFRVEDDRGQFIDDRTRVLVRQRTANRLPIANAGSDQTINHGDDILLNGCASFDPDGDITRYQWFSLAVAPARLVGEGCQLSIAFTTAPAAETSEDYQLLVTDNSGAQAQDQVRVTKRATVQNTAPRIERVMANPNPPRPGESVALLVDAVDADNNALTYEWTQLQGTPVLLSNARVANPAFTAPTSESAETLVFRVSASDGQAAATDDISVTISPADRFATPSLIDCLTAPTQVACFAGLKYIIPNNPLSEALSVSVTPDSANQCSPVSRLDWPHFTGVLHEHTAYSDGFQLTKPADVYARAKTKGWSFAVSTDHSDNMALPVPVVIANDPEFCASNPLACLLSDPDDVLSNVSKWSSTQSQAAQASGPGFSALRGFEWTSDRFGHANVLLSSHYINPKTGPGYALSMESFWAWFLAPAGLGGGDDGLLIFNHPGREDAIHGPLVQFKDALSPLFEAAQQSPLPSNPVQDLLTAEGDPAYAFNDFRYIPGADYRVVGVEVFGKGDEYDTDGKKQSWMAYALDKGWYLAPIGSEDHHDTRWGDENLPKTVMIARTNSPADLREALLARRVYAVAQNHNHLLLDVQATAAGVSYAMGSRISTDAEHVDLSVSVRVRAGQVVPIDLDKVQIDLMSSMADNSERYQPLVSQIGARTQIELPVDAQSQWAFVRVRDGDSGNIVAVSAPIWIQRGAPLPACNNAR